MHARVFGSYARGEETPESDLDILIDTPKKITLFELASILVNLEEVTEKKVDIAHQQFLRPEFKENILGEKIDIL